MINKPKKHVPEYLLDFAREIFRENELPEKARAQGSVTLRRRFRDRGKSDQFGFFDRLTGQWLGDGPEIERYMNLHSFPIVKPIIRANQSAMVQAQVENTVNPTSKNPNLAGVASIGKGIYKFFNNHPDYWSLNLENQINQQCQTDPGYFIHTYHDPDAESLINISIDEYSDQPLETPGEWGCAGCGKGGPLFREQMGRAENGTLPCLNDECDGRAEIFEEPSESEEPQFVGKTEYPAGNIVMEVVSALQIRVDERKTKNGKLRKAEWLEHHFPMEEEDLQAMVPHYELPAPGELSYTLKWEQALESGTELYLRPTSSDGMGRVHPRHEVRKIYMRPDKYRHYRAPKDFDLDRGDGRIAMNRAGKPMLSIKAGQRLIDLFPKGFYFVVVADHLLPWVEACDLRDEWAYGGFLNDSASFWCQPLTELNELARTCNNLYTIDIQHRESGSIVTTIFDRNWFSADDFERNLSPTKEGTFIAPDDDINRHYATVTPPQMTSAMEGVSFIKRNLGDIVGVQPATVGAPGGDQPYAAQRLQVQQSLGLLTPSQQSKAESKSTVLFQFIKFAQRTMPIEWFKYIGTMYGEEWKDQDIEAFLNSNLELDLKVWYKQGSEVPSGLIEQEMKLRQFIIDISNAAAASKNPDLLKPEMISQYAEISGMDYDVENIAADQRLAGARLEKIKAWLNNNRETNLPEATLVELALADRAFKPTSGERNETHIEFYHDRIRALVAAGDPDYALVSCLEEMVIRHQSGIKDQKQTASEIDVEGHAPELAAQAAAAQAQAAQEAELQKQQMAAKQQEQQTKLELMQMQLDGKAEEGDKDRASNAAIEAARLEVKSEELRKADQPEVVTPEASPREVVASSAKYVDLPADAQSEILTQDLGLPGGGTKAVHDATIASAQIAASKQRAGQSRSNGAK